jgi:hypothetical protein
MQALVTTQLRQTLKPLANIGAPSGQHLNGVFYDYVSPQGQAQQLRFRLSAPADHTSPNSNMTGLLLTRVHMINFPIIPATLRHLVLLQQAQQSRHRLQVRRRLQAQHAPEVPPHLLPPQPLTVAGPLAASPRGLIPADA